MGDRCKKKIINESVLHDDCYLQHLKCPETGNVNESIDTGASPLHKLMRTTLSTTSSNLQKGIIIPVLKYYS